MGLIIGLDLDDTLIPTAREYHRVMWQCGAIIDAALGVRSPHPKDIIDVQQRTDMASIPVHGYAIQRFGDSWVHTYQHFAREFAVEVDPAVVVQLRECALGFTRGPFIPFSGAQETLAQLEAAGHELHCITACEGAEGFQYQKIFLSGLSPYFTSVRMTSSDKTQAMRDVFVDPERSIMVGDSKLHDIVPALALGVHAVWIPSTSWSFLHADIDSSTHGTIRSIQELPEYLRQHLHLPLE